MIKHLLFLLSSVFLLYASHFVSISKADASSIDKGTSTVIPSKENYQLGIRNFKKGDIDGAIDAFLQSIYFNRSGYNPQAYFYLGQCYEIKHEDNKAIDALQNCITQTLDNPMEAYVALSKIYLRNNRVKDAEEAARKGLHFSPKVEARGPAYNALGLARMAKQEFENAEDNFKDALGHPPWRYTEAWMNLANVKLLQQNWRGAVAEYRAMIAAKDRLKGIDLADIYLKMGFCLLQVGDHQGALESWHMCLNYNSENADAHFQLGKLLDDENHLSSAIKEYREFVRTADERQYRDQIATVKNRLLMLEQQLVKEPQPSYTKQKEDQKQQTKAEEIKKNAGFTKPFNPANPTDAGF